MNSFFLKKIVEKVVTIEIICTLRLCLFWLKTFSENPFTWNRVFDCAWKIDFSGKSFTLTWKIFSTSVLPSSHFQRRAKRERERERTHRCANRERERERERDCAVEFEIKLVRSPSSSPPRDGEIAPRTHELIDSPRPPARSRHEPTNRSTHLVHWRDRDTNPWTDRPIPHPHRRTHELIAPRLVLWFWFFFLLIFVSCVVYMLQLSVIIFVWILKKCEKHDKNGFSRAFSAKQPNTRKYFPKYFLECNQTLENIFLSRKYFQIFTWKYFTLEKYFTFNQFNQTQPKSLIYWESDKK